MDNSRFIQQAGDYSGTPKRIARCRDRAGEDYVIIEMWLDGGGVSYLAWIGAEYAKHPDEFGDQKPFTGLRWKAIQRA